MSWFARSIAATLSSAHSDDEDDSEATSGDKTPPRASDTAGGVDAGDPDEQPDTPTRGVKGDISELTETLTRRFWGVASFLAPPPTEAKEEEEEEEAPAEAGDEEGVQSPRIAGIRSDLAEIGGRVRTGISMLSNANAVAEFSKIASSFLPFGPGEGEEGDGEAVGVTDEVVVFVKNISKHPETWLDFPLFVNDRLTDVGFSCTKISSFLQILEAREELLQHSRINNKISPKETEGSEQSSESRNVSSIQPEDKEPSSSTSIIQSKSGISETPPVQEPTSDPVADVEADKHPISTTEAEIIDKPVIQEELVVKNETKSIPDVKSNVYTTEDDDKEVDDWLQDMASVPSKTGKTTVADEEEDISFSDLEDD
ncbi:hypothetical protein PR202_gb04632 [Eleusine coracana subsp. coracana]|uniref:BSD domain-containing protein n=1 Tax=Eleusine coracana subsp. coracana TaxID=191504 RepID=A0AAV5E507_ELECO|nr:hypothetical protein PR202_gb04632 [Eleusine coracana subsp. coracana]